HISNLRSGKARPSPELADVLDERLEGGGSLRALVPTHERRRPQPAMIRDDDDEIAAVELGRLVEVTEVGTGTVERLELAVDELAIAYPSTPSAELYGPGARLPPLRWRAARRPHDAGRAPPPAGRGRLAVPAGRHHPDRPAPRPGRGGAPANRRATGPGVGARRDRRVVP